MRAIHNILAGGLLCFASCSKHEFIIPDDFRGEIQIWKDPSATVALSPRGGTLVVTVPGDGRLPVRDDQPLYGEHSTSARFITGRQLTCDILPADKVRAGEVVFWELGSTSGSDHEGAFVHAYFVGTEAEAKKAWGIR